LTLKGAKVKQIKAKRIDYFHLFSTALFVLKNEPFTSKKEGDKLTVSHSGDRCQD
jgi:hypothetical protein